MKTIHSIFLVIVSALVFIGWNSLDNQWITEKHNGYTLLYSSNDKENIKEYNKLVENGITAVRSFFDGPYRKEFSIYIHPNRQSLDSSWRKDWNMPEFKSECWMVASGVANRLDMLSPVRWDKEACGHFYSETSKTQQLITHELVHVYHGQLNLSSDFSNVEGIDWFVEGLATFASGQCDTIRIAEIKKAITGNKIPSSLDNFWTGTIRYGLSGSLVMFIDYKYGRIKLKELLTAGKKSEILSVLNTTESALLDEWKRYIQHL